MTPYTHRGRAWLLSLVCLAPAVAVAEETAAPASAAAPLRGLSPSQLTAIRAVGRNVLTAKLAGGEDAADRTQLTRLRGALDTLSATQGTPDSRPALTPQVDESPGQRKRLEADSAAREEVRSRARALVAEIRNWRAAKSAVRTGVVSPPDAMEDQRADLLERWSAELEDALTDDSAQGRARLARLHERLRASKSSLNDDPVVTSTPTMQAMPAGYVPPKKAGRDDSAMPDHQRGQR